MKLAIFTIALISSFCAFANDLKKGNDEASKAATEACKEMKDKKEHKKCMHDHMSKPAAEATTAAPEAHK